LPTYRQTCNLLAQPVCQRPISPARQPANPSWLAGTGWLAAALRHCAARPHLARSPDEITPPSPPQLWRGQAHGCQPLRVPLGRRGQAPTGGTLQRRRWRNSGGTAQRPSTLSELWCGHSVAWWCWGGAWPAHRTLPRCQQTASEPRLCCLTAHEAWTGSSVVSSHPIVSLRSSHKGDGGTASTLGGDGAPPWQPYPVTQTDQTCPVPINKH
jgi:hypothetical protein